MKTADFNTTGNERKRLVAAIREYIKEPINYMGAPTFAYETDYFTIDRNGRITFNDTADSDAIECLLDYLHIKGFDAVQAEAEAEPDAGQEPTTKVNTPVCLEEEHSTGKADNEPISENNVLKPDGLTISIPKEGITDTALENIKRIISGKEALIKKALGVEALPVETYGDTISFPWFKAIPAPEVIDAASHLLCKIAAMAKTQKFVTASYGKPVENEKYSFRCWLLRLGFIGTEYKEARKTLLLNFTGSGAYKSGKKHVTADVETNTANATGISMVQSNDEASDTQPEANCNA